MVYSIYMWKALDKEKSGMRPWSTGKKKKESRSRVGGTILRKNSAVLEDNLFLMGGTIYTQYPYSFYKSTSLIIFSSDLLESQDPCQSSKKSDIHWDQKNLITGRVFSSILKFKICDKMFADVNSIP